MLANLVPLLGVLQWHWPIGEIVLLYWFENVVLGVLNLLRIALARPTFNAAPPGHARVLQRMKFFLVPFFALHYGMFCLGHGTFVLATFFRKPEGLSIGIGPDTVLQTLALDTPMMVAAGALVASHTISLVQNFLLGGEYRRVTPMELMHRPYGRIIVLHVAILLGAFAVAALDGPVVALVTLVLGKIVLDLHLHQREHRRDRAWAPTPAAAGERGVQDLQS